MTEPQLDPQGEAREALSSAVADFGQRILSDARMIRSRMSDLLPDLPRERHLLDTAAEADVAGELTQHVQGQRLDPQIAIQMVSRSFSDRMSIDLASSTWVTTEYARALGYHVRSDAPLLPPPTTPATVGPGFYQGYSPPQAPAGGGVYGSPAPPVLSARPAPAAAIPRRPRYRQRAKLPPVEYRYRDHHPPGCSRLPLPRPGRGTAGPSSRW